jgi:hypothetical protein
MMKEEKILLRNFSSPRCSGASQSKRRSSCREHEPRERERKWEKLTRFLKRKRCYDEREEDRERRREQRESESFPQLLSLSLPLRPTDVSSSFFLGCSSTKENPPALFRAQC